MKRSLLAAGAALALLAGPFAAEPARADGAAYPDPSGDTRSATTDVTGVFVALNRDVFSTTATVRTYDAGQLAQGLVIVAVDTDRDGAADRELRRDRGGEGVVYDARGDVVPGCPVVLSASAPARSLTVSTSAACLGSPASVRVSWGLAAGAAPPPGQDPDIDIVPDSGDFGPAVTRWTVQGAIGEAWRRSGGQAGPLGDPLADEAATRGGAYGVFAGGTVLWSPASGAHWVRGAIRARYAALSSEYGPAGFPVTDEVPSAGGGAVNVFERASVYWSPRTGAHALSGAIREAWGTQGYEAGRLGFPTTEEFDAPDGRKQEFQGGNVVWTPQRGAVIAYPRTSAGSPVRR